MISSTGEDILFLDLSSDPELFKGPKGDKQVRTNKVKAYIIHAFCPKLDE